MKSKNISKVIFLNSLSIMKDYLDLMAFKFGKNTDEYTYLKKEIMNYAYGGLLKTFKELEKDGVLTKCECSANLRHGFKKCSKCSGSGYRSKI